MNLIFFLQLSKFCVDSKNPIKIARIFFVFEITASEPFVVISPIYDENMCVLERRC